MPNVICGQTAASISFEIEILLSGSAIIAVCCLSCRLMDIDRSIDGPGGFLPSNHQSFRESPSVAATSPLFVFVPGTHCEAGHGTQLGKAPSSLSYTHARTLLYYLRQSPAGQCVMDLNRCGGYLCESTCPLQSVEFRYPKKATKGVKILMPQVSSFLHFHSEWNDKNSQEIDRLKSRVI